MAGSRAVFVLITITCCLLENTNARPAAEEQGDILMEVPVETQVITLKPSKEATPTSTTKKDSARDIIEKIKQINGNLKKPNRKIYFSKYQAPVYPQYQHGQGDYYNGIEQFYGKKLEEDTDEERNFLGDEQNDNIIPRIQPRMLNIRPKMNKFMPYLLKNPSSYLDDEPISFSYPSIESLLGANNVKIPKYIMVPDAVNSQQDLYFSGMGRRNDPLFKQFPSVPSIPWQWPLAQYFPIIIKDPLLAFLHGGGLTNIVEYGQVADVCQRAHLKTNLGDDEKEILDTQENEDDNSIAVDTSDRSSRLSRAINLEDYNGLNKRSSKKGNSKKSKKSSKISTKKPVKILYEDSETPEDSQNDEDDGDLKFTEFGLFGNKKPVAPSPGFFINRLKVRRGGVAIAGPGGIATAGRGGTAIVGPGGLAYTQPGGLAIAGPSAKVVALSSEIDLNKFISQLRIQANARSTEDSSPRKINIPDGGKVVATGPVVYYHKSDDT